MTITAGVTAEDVAARTDEGGNCNITNTAACGDGTFGWVVFWVGGQGWIGLIWILTERLDGMIVRDRGW